jgi:energy-coupling factor transporter ATP-binding protein EcfA2
MPSSRAVLACACAQVRGVSGGQRKRVTTGEMIVGPQPVLMLDEISTGLDASTTRLITQCLVNLAHLQQSTILVALLQPPPEVFELFDDVLLLVRGGRSLLLFGWISKPIWRSESIRNSVSGSFVESRRRLYSLYSEYQIFSIVAALRIRFAGALRVQATDSWPAAPAERWARRVPRPHRRGPPLLRGPGLCPPGPQGRG